MAILNPPSVNALQKTLAAELLAGATASATLSNTTNIVNGTGMMVIDRVDANGESTASKREYISFTATSGATVTTLTRNADGGGSDQDHAVGAIVEFINDVVQAKAVKDIIETEHSTAGAHTTDVIAELTAAAGVTVDGLLIKDGQVGPWDGWMPANESWAYASATTITIPAGGAAKYAMGDRIKLTQTTVKYFVVTVVADTLLTVTGGTDYTVADAAISLNYYSHQESPVGFPQWFALAAPTWAVGNFDDGAGGQPTTTETRFCINGRTFKAHCRATGTKAGTGKQITFPQAAFPIVPANSTARTCIGVAYVEGATDNIMSVLILGPTIYLNAEANIADNQAIGNLSFNISYEI